jgi:hypothetical protein
LEGLALLSLSFHFLPPSLLLCSSFFSPFSGDSLLLHTGDRQGQATKEGGHPSTGIFRINRHSLLPLSNRKIAARHENQRPEGRGREGRRKPKKRDEEGREGEGRRREKEEKKGEEGRYVQSVKSKDLLFRFRVGGIVIFPSTSGTPHCRKINIQKFPKINF